VLDGLRAQGIPRFLVCSFPERRSLPRPERRVCQCKHSGSYLWFFDHDDHGKQCSWNGCWQGPRSTRPMVVECPILVVPPGKPLTPQQFGNRNDARDARHPGRANLIGESHNNLANKTDSSAAFGASHGAAQDYGPPQGPS